MSTNRYDFTSNPQNFVRNNAKLLYVSSAKYGGDWHSTLHTHQCSELFYVTGGKGQFQIEEEIYQVETNDLVLINPNVSHTEISFNSNPLEYIVVGMEGLELSIKTNEDIPYRIIDCSSFRDTILFYLQTMLHEIEAKSHGYETICQDLLEVLMITLNRQTKFSTDFVPVRKKSTRLSNMVRRYIDGHYTENITLDTLANLCHVSRYYLVHTFTDEYGISPINYMTTCRLREAKQMLKNDDYSLSFISRILGFSSPSYFSQAFKKHEGISPNEYRKLSQSEPESI